ncbi:hypothetical protein PIB30_029689 [Stylosanthes scabra]|uniref:F-box domain-containing protein n=1 Tax=Stylosanthes scabra TaxID=79078 RepID=A0ABU6VC58_9FABA|nr:hypothetical protein [Stylosanthes scabra]
MKPHDYDERNRKPLRVTRNSTKRLLSSVVMPSQPLPVLPDELIREILLRLPARTLLGLRSVCRSWRTLISSSKFANDHVQRSISADPCLSDSRVAYCNWGYNCKRIVDFPIQNLLKNPSELPEVVFFEGGSNCRIIGCCNGLLCVLEVEGANTIKNRAMLWNPCTGFASRSPEIGGFLSLCGFGYDHVNDKYKLVGIVKQKQKKKHPSSTTTIYTFCPNPSRRTIQESPPSGRYIGAKGLFVPGTGTLNWIRLHGTMNCSVVSLDLVKETFSEFSLPCNETIVSPRFFSPRLCLLRNCLAFSFRHQKTHWAVWLMKEYGVPQSWTKLAMICMDPLLDGKRIRQLRPLRRISPLYIWGNYVVVVASSSKIVLYNLDDGSFEFPLLDPRPLSNSAGLRFHVYHESLVSPTYRGLRSSSSRMQLIKP